MSHRITIGLLVMAVCFPLVGCSSGSGVEIGEVTGRVLRNGKPVASADVSFFPEQGRPSYATTDSAGIYTLAYDAEQNGAVVGTHTVSVSIAAGEAGGPPGELGEPSLRPTRVARGTKMGPVEVTLPTPVTVSRGENSIDLNLPES